MADQYLAPFTMLRYLDAMPLQHLTVKLGAIFDGGLFFGRAAFRQITHLHVLGSLTVGSLNFWNHYEGGRTDADEWKAGLASIPCLTHFAFDRPNSRDLVYPALHECPRLECCILLCPPGVDGTAWLPKSQDVRFVAVNAPDAQADWHSGVVGGEDMWVRAEAMIAMRRAEGMRAEKP